MVPGWVKEAKGLDKTSQRAKRTRRLAQTTIAVAVAHALSTIPASAAQIEVNSTGDTTADDAFCTLREAITTFNAGDDSNGNGCTGTGDAFGTNDTLTFSVATVSLTNGEVVIDTDLAIQGGVGVSIQGTADVNYADRLFRIDRSNVVSMDRVTLTGGSASAGSGFYGYGGAVAVEPFSSVTITNSTITGNTAARGGGVAGRYAEISLTNTMVNNNSATVAGGGIHLFTNGYYGFSMLGGSASGNTVSSENNGVGGGISLYAGGSEDSFDAELYNVAIENNTAKFNGGGIFARYVSVSIDSASLISGNMAMNGGGGIENENGYLTINNSTIQDNSAPSATSTGGGILIDRGSLELTETTVTGNQAADGGGIYINRMTGGGSINLTNTTISYNDASVEAGGGLAVRGSAGGNALVRFYDSTISNNMAHRAGGGIYAVDSSLQIFSSSVSNNRADGASVEKGGGIYARATAVDTSKVYIEDAVVSGNSALETGGVALYDTYSLIVRTTFNGNQARSSGAMRVGVGSEVRISESIFAQNSVSSYGSAINVDQSELRVTNTTLAENDMSSLRGGAINISASEVTLNHVTITDNDNTNDFGRGSGIRAVSGGTVSDVTITNSLISGNTAYDLKDLYIAAGGVNITSNNNLFGDDSAETNDLLSGFVPDATDIVASSNGTDPTSINIIRIPLADNGGATLTVALPTGSPAVDAADRDDCAGASDVDQRSVERPIGPECDIGAFEGSIDSSTPFVIPTRNGKTVIIDL